MSPVSRQSSRGLRHHSSPTFLCLHKFDVRGAQCLPCAELTAHSRTATIFWVRHLLIEPEAHRECHTAHKYRGTNVKHWAILTTGISMNSFDECFVQVIPICDAFGRGVFFCFAILKAAHKQNTGLTLSSEVKIIYFLFSRNLRPNVF